MWLNSLECHLLTGIQLFQIFWIKFKEQNRYYAVPIMYLVHNNTVVDIYVVKVWKCAQTGNINFRREEGWNDIGGGYRGGFIYIWLFSSWESETKYGKMLM